MQDKLKPPTLGSMLRSNEPELLRDRRAQIEYDRREAAERREHARQEQSSPLNSPEARIRIWERLHGLTLPRSSSHKLLAVIARSTGQSLEAIAQVQSERRVTRPSDGKLQTG